MSSPFLVSVPDEQVGIARMWATEVLQSGIESLRNYTGINAPGRYEIGYLGELAFARWADFYGVLFQHRVHLVGASDAPEFVAWSSGKRLRIDIKTCSDQAHKHMMMPCAQELDADLYVGARMSSQNLIELHGYATDDDLRAVPDKDFGHGPTRAIPLGSLNPMSDLLTVLDGRRVVKRRNASTTAKGVV